MKMKNRVNLRSVWTIVVSVAILSTTAAHAAAVIYEPFAQAATANLNGVTASSTGLSPSTWVATANAWAIVNNSLFWGTLESSGRKIQEANSAAASQVSVTIPAGTLSSLPMADGAELWFSVLLTTAGDISTNPDFGFAIGSGLIGTANNIPLASGQAIGFTVKNGNLHASHWSTTLLTRSVTGKGVTGSTTYLVVGKITWGATSDKIDIYLPNSSLALGTVQNTVTSTANLTQSGFNKITIGRKAGSSNPWQIDEIRFGATSDDVLPVGTSAPALLSITDNMAGGPIGEDVAEVTYTLTFDKNMDFTTITAADFANVGTAEATVGTIAQVSPAVITVKLLPTSTGTLQLQIPTTAVIKSLAQVDLDVDPALLDDTTITINSGVTPPGTPTSNRWWDGTDTSGATDGASGGGTATWDTTTTRWDRGAAFESPVAWDNAVSLSAILGGTAGTVTLGEPISLKNLTFSNTAGTYIITGSTLNFTAGTITAPNPPNASTVGARIESNIIGAPAINLYSLAGNEQFSLRPAASCSMSIGAITGNGGTGSAALNLEGGALSTGTIASSTGPKVLVTSGSWTLNGNSSAYAHAISGGTLTLNANLKADNRDVLLSGGVLNYNVAGAVSATVATTTSGDLGFRITGGSIDQTSGAAINTSASTQSMTWNSWTFIGTNGDASNLHLGSGTVFLKSTPTSVSVTHSAATLIVGGVIQNDSTTGRSLTKAGAGTLELRGTSTYTGATTVNAGTLKLGANNVIPNASNVSIGTATLDANTRMDTAGTLNVTGAAVINLGSGAALTFANSSAITWNGASLNITGTLGATSLCFGAGGLSEAQLAKISVNGSGLGTYTLDASGYLMPQAAGTLIQFF